MAEEVKAEAQEAVEADTSEKDWKAEYERMRAHSREWEKKAKANQGAADELERLKEAQMTEQDRAIARAEAAEGELAAVKAEQARTEAAVKIAHETGVPLDMLLFCSDEEAMTEFAKKYAENARVHSAPSATGASRVIRGGETKPSNADLFAEFAETLFKK